MAQFQLQPVANNRRQPTANHSLKIDMTPMVDLGFLLITFFIFTTAMSEPAATTLYMPADGTGTKVGETNALTILLGEDNKLFYYHGAWEDAVVTNGIQTTNFNVQNGIGKVIRQKQRALADKRDELTLMIKPLDLSSYENFINALDEVMINDLKRYAFMEPSKEEKSYFATRD